MVDALARVSQEIGNVGIRDRVPNSNAILTPTDHAGVVKDSKMLGYILLNAVDSCCQTAGPLLHRAAACSTT